MKFEIWREGYNMNGGYSDATFIGYSYGETFKEAVLFWYSRNPDKAFNFDPKNLTDWGCRLYDNETAARSTFG